MDADHPLLKRAYGLTGKEEAESLYDGWARTYDARLVEADEQPYHLRENLTCRRVVLDAA